MLDLFPCSVKGIYVQANPIQVKVHHTLYLLQSFLVRLTNIFHWWQSVFPHAHYHGENAVILQHCMVPVFTTIKLIRGIIDRDTGRVGEPRYRISRWAERAIKLENGGQTTNCGNENIQHCDGWCADHIQNYVTQLTRIRCIMNMKLASCAIPSYLVQQSEYNKRGPQVNLVASMQRWCNLICDGVERYWMQPLYIWIGRNGH